jgi:hypothetical protein
LLFDRALESVHRQSAAPQSRQVIAFGRAIAAYWALTRSSLKEPVCSWTASGWCQDVRLPFAQLQ